MTSIREEGESETTKFAIRWLLKSPPHLKHIATLPCEILMSTFDYYYSQGSAETHLRCSGIFHHHFIADVLLSVPVEEF